MIEAKTTDENHFAKDFESYTPEMKCVACERVCEVAECCRCSCSSENLKDFTHLEIYCDVCIGPHIRQKHEVLDYKGYKPDVCATHDMLSSMFCFECEETFCFKCLGPHCKHDYRPIRKKQRK